MATGSAGMSSLKVFRRTAFQSQETGRSDSFDASPVRVIRVGRISHAGVTAHVTVDRISTYSRRQRECTSGGRFPACADRPLSGDMPVLSGATYGLPKGSLKAAPTFSEG